MATNYDGKIDTLWLNNMLQHAYIDNGLKLVNSPESNTGRVPFGYFELGHIKTQQTNTSIVKSLHGQTQTFNFILHYFVEGGRLGDGLIAVEKLKSYIHERLVCSFHEEYITEPDGVRHIIISCEAI